ncbi:hypothetical protein [Scytonema sp. PCC 10023]|uniref:hypothetical protein n=1 Tax=Scytonema sp. PCC 10023 TaxID=1680591 RepID=UPI0039C72BFA
MVQPVALEQQLNNKLLLPGDPKFDLWLYSSLPPGESALTYIVRADGSGLLEAVDEANFTEYIEGGEYHARLEEIGEDDAADNYG